MTTVKQRAKRLFTGLVSLKPAKEIAGNATEAAKQDVSAFNTTLVVPQEETETAERINTLRLFDAALTPNDMAGSYGIPPWALDEARMLRARTWAKRAGMYPEISSPDVKSFNESMFGLDASNATFYQSKINQSATLHGFPVDTDKVEIETWDEAIEHAMALAERASRERTPPPQQSQQPKPGKGNPGEGESETERGPTSGEPMPGQGKGPLAKGKLPQTYAMPNTPPPPKPEIQNRKPRSLAECREFKEDELEQVDPWPLGTTPPPKTGREVTGHCENFHKPDEIPMRARKRKKGQRRRSATEGVTLGRVNRLWLDGKIFKSGVVRGGYMGRGTIMVDMSGSMQWTETDIKNALDALPEATVYGYCGSSHRGRLVKLADRGKTADPREITKWKDQHRLGGGNEIDDSALRFLCRQSKPRIWISDGGVCAANCDTYYMQQECDKAIAAGRIVRVNNAAEAVKFLAGRKSY